MAGAVAVAAVKARTPKRKVLGVKVPRSISLPKPHVSTPDISSKSMRKTAKKVGKASQSLGQKGRAVSQDIERVADSAERIGKILK